MNELRPPKTECFSFAMAPEVADMLDKLCAHYGMNRSKVVRGLIIRQARLLKIAECHDKDVDLLFW